MRAKVPTKLVDRLLTANALRLGLSNKRTAHVVLSFSQAHAFPRLAQFTPESYQALLGYQLAGAGLIKLSRGSGLR